MSPDANASVSRRGFLRVATGATAAGAAGTAAGQEGNESGGNQTGGNQTGGNQTGGNQTGGNQTGGGGGGGGGATKEVTVGPGGELVFEPADLTIAPGTTVKFVWDSPGHNIVVENQPSGANWQGTKGGASKLFDPPHTHSHAFDTEGTYDYYCAPHKQAGMVGSIEVSADAGGGGGGGGGPPQIPDSAKTLGIASVIGMLSTLGLAYFFLRFGGDYEG